MKIFLLGILIIICPFSYANNVPVSLQSGDLIFRKGNHPISEIVSQIDGGKYSHVGLLYHQDGRWYVIHATPPENNLSINGVIKQPLAVFIDKQNAKNYRFYRVKATKEQHAKATKVALSQIGRRFSLHHDQGTYCTLLVYEAWKKANIDFSVPFTDINFGPIKGQYLLPISLVNSRNILSVGK